MTIFPFELSNEDSLTFADANVEPDPSDAPNEQDKATPFDSPVRITFLHTRGRLADIDGLSGKAAIDGLVAVGILRNDTAKQVEEVRHHQVKGKPEKTEIIIEEIE